MRHPLRLFTESSAAKWSVSWMGRVVGRSGLSILPSGRRAGPREAIGGRLNTVGLLAEKALWVPPSFHQPAATHCPLVRLNLSCKMICWCSAKPPSWLERPSLGATGDWLFPGSKAGLQNDWRLLSGSPRGAVAGPSCLHRTAGDGSDSGVASWKGRSWCHQNRGA